MRRALVPTALLLLLASSVVLAGVPPAIWFEDHFDTYGVGTRLAWCDPSWDESPVIEPGKTSPWPAQNVDCHIASGGIGGCSGSQYVVMQGYRPAWTDATLENPNASCAETDRDPPPGGVSWEAYASGSVQILYFKAKRAYDELPDPPLHVGVYLMDNNVLGAQPIMGWVLSCKYAMPQLNLPTYTVPWTTNRYYSAEGIGHGWGLPADDVCKEFTAYYYPVAADGRAAGTVEFYVYASGADQLLWTTNAGAGRVSRSVYVRDYGWHNGYQDADVVYLDDLYVGTTSKPVVTAPIGGAFVPTNTPTIQWTNAFGSGMTAYQVRVCSADNPAGPIVYDSGVIAGSATSKVTTALPTCTQLWAFVNEQYASWTGWSLQGNGGFYCVTAVPPTPTVTSPSGTVVGAKPAVIFSGTCYGQFEVKVTTDPGGSTVVWTSGVVSSLKSGASCEELLVAGTQYYAFAQTTNPVGSSAWSAASAFQVTRAGEGTDIRDMNETWGDQDVLEHSAAAPDDGFGTYVGSGGTWAYLKRQVLPAPFNDDYDKYGNPANWVTCEWWPDGDECGPDGQNIAYCGGVWIIPPVPDRTDTELVGGSHPADYVISMWKTHISLSSNDMRKHRVANVSLDKGVTVMTYASGRCFEGEGCGYHGSRNIGEEAQIYIMDDYGTGKCMASFRYGVGEAGICTNNATWTTGSYTDLQNPDRPGQGWHVVRITGRNRVVGDPTTCEWNYYIDEDSTPLVTATGVMDQSIACIAASDIEDAVAIGCGDACLSGSWLYDWTAVNTDGDYAPGEWFYGEEYATLSEAVAEGRGKMITITGEAVITAIKLETGSQVGFWVQDVATTDYSNIYIPSTVTTNVERGHKVTGISGLLAWSNATGASLTLPGFTVSATDANWPPVTMQSKALVAGGYPTEYPDGTLTVGKFTQITGEITDLLYLLDGSYAVYLDDGCGLVDGRSADGGNALAKGVRVIVPEPWSFFGAIGDYYEARGICVSETAEGRTVRTLLGATFTEVAAP